MSLDEIKKLFEKIQLFSTLDSIGILLSYTNDESITTVFNTVFRKKCEHCSDGFEGINEYDYICQILNFDISELNKNMDKFSQKEFLFIRNIINNALINIEANSLTNRIIPILNEYKDIGTDKYIEEKKIENFFNKYDINELYLFDIILSYNCEPDTQKYKEILDKVRKAKEKKAGVNICPDSSLFNLLNKNNRLNDDELSFLYELVENASSYLSSVQDYSYVYEQMIEDFNINEYPVISIYKLEESLLKELENRKEKKRIYNY